MADGEDANSNSRSRAFDRALANGVAKEDIFAAVQEVTIIAMHAIPGTTQTDSTSTQRFLHLATLGILWEKGYLDEHP